MLIKSKDTSLSTFISSILNKSKENRLGHIRCIGWATIVPVSLPAWLDRIRSDNYILDQA